MRKKMTRFLSLLLVLSMVLSMGLSVGASAEGAEGEDLTVSFVTDEHATVDLYYSKDNYETADETNVTSAYVRGKGSTAIDNSGDGQVNFKVNVDEGYTYTISVSPESGYNNCKGEDETGVADIWRITKISADLTVTITTSATQTEIDDDTLWAYLDDGTDPAGDSTDSGYERTSWTSADYDDSAWKSSTGPFGAKNGAIASLGGGYDSYTLLTQYKEDGSTDIEAYFFRTTVTIEDASAVTAIVGQVIYDDAATVYINGTKVIGFDDDSITANLEYGGSNASTPKTGDISLTDSTILSLLQDGENVIAVEIHQGRSSSSDIYFDMDLTFSSEEITAEQTDVNIAVGSDETERNITWYANVEGTGTLYLAKESDLVNGAMPADAAVYSATGTASTTKDGYCYYQVSVTGLESGTSYAYQLVNGETAGEVYTFTTGADDGSFTFALVGDPQIGAGSTASDIEGWEDTLTYISENMTDAEFILSVGDQVNTANNETEYSGFLSTVLSSMTLATVIGNHDSSSVAYSEHFNITNASEYGSTAAGTDYYFVYENVLFLVLNSNNTSAAEHQAFMKQAIEEAEAEYDIDWKVVTFHHSVYSVASHATEDSIISLRNSLVPIFTELDIDVVLMGHDHVYCRTYMMDGLEVMDDTSIYDDESYSSITDPSGILYVTVNSASGSKYYNIQENVTFEYAAVMNQDKERNVSQVTVTETSFTITTYAIENGTEVVDTFTINRTAEEADAVEQTDVNIAVGSDETGRNITWYANVEGTGTLYLAKESDLVNGAMPADAAVYSATGTASTTKDGYCYYQVSVTGLESGTTYAYQLVNGETAGEVYTFTTGEDDGSFTFALVGDPQIGAGSTASDIEGWENTLTYISENMADAEFILSVGDQVNIANDETQYSGFLSTVLSSMTLATVIGNHDSSSVAYSEHFNITNASEYGSTAAGTDYYFVYENVLFLVLNSNNTSAAEHQAFMKQAIEEAEAEYDIDWKVVTFHHSVYSVASHATEDSILSLRNSLVPIFTELDIDVVLMGHDHVYCRTYMMDGLEVMDDTSIYDDESYSSITDPSGILYVTVNSASGSKYYNIQENVAFEYAAVMNQDKERNVSQVTVTETSFTITTYAIENGTEVVDTFTINRTTGEESESYTVTAAEAENGTVTVSPASATAGESVTVTAEPDEGYELASLTVTDAEGNEIAVTDGVFTMPASAVTVTAVFQESTSHAHTYEGTVEKTEPTCTEDGFYVITVACTECGDEAYTCTVTIPATGHTCGEGTVTVAATRYTTGVMSYTCTVCGETFTTKIAKTGASFLFDDVTNSGSYYYTAVYWAYDLGVTTGTSANLFSPGASCTRAQFVTFLYRLAQATGADTSVTITDCDFTDVSSSASYYQAMLWAVENEITNGTSSTTFSPSKTITRAQAVTMLYRYEKNIVNGGVAPTVSTTSTDYTDVVAGSFYEDAVLWAVDQEITSGTSDTTFSPTQNCTRAMMVTFLYRYAAAQD